MTWFAVIAAVLVALAVKSWRDERAYKRWIAEHRRAAEAEIEFYARRERR